MSLLWILSLWDSGFLSRSGKKVVPIELRNSMIRALREWSRPDCGTEEVIAAMEQIADEESVDIGHPANIAMYKLMLRAEMELPQLSRAGITRLKSEVIAQLKSKGIVV